jgi:hypothetical protein
MSLTATYSLELTVNETLTVPDSAGGNATIRHNGFNSTGSLGASTTPPVTKVSAFKPALVAGEHVIDLTALPGVTAANVDGTGLKVQAIKIRNPAANSANLIIEPGASNAYNLFGASFKITLHPGEELLFKGNDHASMPEVASGAKNIKLSDGGTGVEVHEVIILLG